MSESHQPEICGQSGQRALTQARQVSGNDVGGLRGGKFSPVSIMPISEACSHERASSRLTMHTRPEGRSVLVLYFHPDLVPEMDRAWPQRRVLQLAGVDTDFIYAVVHDTVLAVGNGPDGSVFLFPLLTVNSEERPDAALIANYIAFVTESPVIVRASDENARPTPSWPVLGVEASALELFETAQQQLLDASVGLRWSPHLVPYLPWDAFDVPETVEVAGVDAAVVNLGPLLRAADCLSLYALSVRQVDPFAEYVFLYRLFEFVSASNGKDWITAHLPQVGGLAIGHIEAEFDGLYGGVEIPDRFVAGVQADVVRDGPHGRKLVDLASLMAALAMERRNSLRERLTDAEIAARLYEDERCGLAHANPQRSFLLHDNVRDVAEVLLDLPLVRYLARAAVCEFAARLG